MTFADKNLFATSEGRAADPIGCNVTLPVFDVRGQKLFATSEGRAVNPIGCNVTLPVFDVRGQKLLSINATKTYNALKNLFISTAGF